MGKQSRLKHLRRHERELTTRYAGGRNETPLRVLRAIHQTIQNHCHESPRRCWEYLLEMLAHSTGWPTDTAEAKHLWDKMADETRWLEFIQSWVDEVEWAKRNRESFSEPLGMLLEEIEATNSNLGQFFTPMPVVRMINELTMADYEPPDPRTGMPGRRALDPCVGTGRFMIDALIHDDGVLMHGVDLDLWVLRCAMMNVRLLSRWTSLRVKDPGDRLKPLRRAARAAEEMFGVIGSSPLMHRGEDGGDVLVLGGRSVFMHGNSLILDLNYTPNWLCAGWHWLPKPWEDNLKIDGYYGSYNAWEAAGRPPLHAEPTEKDVQFDYSMPSKMARAASP